MRRRAILAVLPALMLLSCASGTKKSGASALAKGFRVLDAVVVGRSYEPPLSGGTALSMSGTWYLDFEARDGEATAHYRFPVSRSDYNRYGEGTRIQLLMGRRPLARDPPRPVARIIHERLRRDFGPADTASGLLRDGLR